ncbi:MAG TPA: SRPBCC family protein [Thermoanaerobaculia bacterium]|nr:SRPBCC family protein [Thermoanaerobaculia bacterium]
MSKPHFIYVTFILTTAEKLWNALTRGDLTQRYWYDRRIESDWQVGSPVRFFDGDSDVLTDSGEILVCDPPRQLIYTFRPEAGEGEEAMDFSRVSFGIESLPGMVKFTLIHDQLPDQEMANAFREGWAPILSSLKTFLETGEPMPRIRKLEEEGRPAAG